MMSKISARFRRAPAPVAAETPAPEAKVEASPAADAPAAEAEPVPSRAARLVERARSKRAGWTQRAAMVTAAGQVGLREAGAPALAVVALLTAAGIGYGVGATGRARDVEAEAATRWLDTSADLRRAGEEIGRLAGELKAVKASVAGLRTDGEGAGAGRLAEMLERSERETGARLGRLADQVERATAASRDPARLQMLSDKLDRLEKLVAAPAAAKAGQDVSQTGSLGEPKKAEADPRKVPIEGFVVRDYDDGFALLQGKNGRYLEVAVGYTVPGIGKVEAIERRGRQWVVVTSKGFIAER